MFEDFWAYHFHQTPQNLHEAYYCLSQSVSTTKVMQ